MQAVPWKQHIVPGSKSETEAVEQEIMLFSLRQQSWQFTAVYST